MTILAALNAFHDRLSDRGDMPPYGYTTERISFCIVLSAAGDMVDTIDLRKDGKTARDMAVPRSSKRSGSIPKPFFCWDKSSMVIGLTMDKKTKQAVETPKHYAAFREFHEAALANTDDAGLLALLAFVRKGKTPQDWNTDEFKPMIDANIIFALEDDLWEHRYLHDRPAVRDLWAIMVDEAQGETATCLVTGKQSPIARIHPAIKGVVGAQSSGASMVSFNAPSFESFAREQGDNAPVSEAAAAGYGAALNALLGNMGKDRGLRLQIGDATTVFWADASQVGEQAAVAAEEGFAFDIAPPAPSDEGEAAKLRADLAEVARGRAISELTPNVNPATRCYVLGLSPAMSRLSVRFWQTGSFSEFAKHIEQHWRDLYIEPYPWKTGPAAWALLYETALQREAKNIPPLLGGEVMRSILTGSRYPGTLLSSIIIRIRADGDVSGQRAAIIKACLQRDARLSGSKGEIPVSLDKTDTNPAYRLGRLFATLEYVQYKALGKDVNATIRDKFFGAAAATPASIFPVLIKNSMNHLSLLRKDGKNGWVEMEIEEILGAFGSGFPKTLRTEDQGRFAIGYYHQRQSYFASKNGNGNGKASAEIEPVIAPE